MKDSAHNNPPLQKHLFLAIICQLLFTCLLQAQEVKSTFYENANGTVGKKEHVNALSFLTQNRTDSFYAALNKAFGKPSADEYFILYEPKRNPWVKDKIILRIQKSLDIESDKQKIYDIFIFVETEKGTDLLAHNHPAFRRIKDFFLKLFNTTVKNARRDPDLDFE